MRHRTTPFLLFLILTVSFYLYMILIYEILRFKLQTSRKYKGLYFNLKFFMQESCFFYLLTHNKSNKKMCKSLGDDRSLMEDAETTTTKTSTTTSTTFSTTTTTTATSTTTTFVPTTTSLVTTTELQKSSLWFKK